MEEYFKQNSECSICFKRFVDPYVLQCQHTFCLVCIHKIKQNGKVKCAMCRDTCSYDVIKVDYKTKELVAILARQSDETTNSESEDETDGLQSLVEGQRKTLTAMTKEIKLAMKNVQHSQLETESNVARARENSKALRDAFIKRMDKIDVEIDNIYAAKAASLQKADKDLKSKFQLLQAERNDLDEKSPPPHGFNS